MSVVIIVNIIVSVGIMLGGFCMRSYAVSPADYTIGFRTKRAMSNSEAWEYANKKCGILWIITGLNGVPLTLLSVFLMENERVLSFFQAALLVVITVSAVISAVAVEIQLKNKFGR
jgi:uncharacterized membrane protein